MAMKAAMVEDATKEIRSSGFTDVSFNFFKCTAPEEKAEFGR